MKNNNLINKKFNKLLVIDKAFTKNREVYWKCICECGNTIYVSTANLNSNRVKSCGCLKLERLLERSTTHNKSKTRIYHIWKSMRQRCYNENDYSYKNYGGREIKVCDEWYNDFTAFYNWSIEHNYQENLTIDRIDNNGNYEPENCRWVSKLIQSNNTRFNKYITINNETKSLADWCRYYNLNYNSVEQRINRYHWEPSKALLTPFRKINKH